MTDSEFPNFAPQDDLARIKRARWKQFLIPLIVIVLIALVPLFFYGTKGFIVEISPTEIENEASLSTEKGLAFVWGRRTILIGGSATVRVTAPGYFPAEHEIDRSLSDQMISIALQPLPGTVAFEVYSDSEFTLQVDGANTTGDFPRSVELAKGRHVASVTGPDIVPIHHEFEVEGLGVLQEIRLTTERASSFVAISTIPGHATIEFDGSIFAEGGYDGRISIGSHTARIAAPNYVPSEIAFSVAHDERVDLGTVELLPVPATVSVTSNPNQAMVLIDGSYAGTTPIEVSVDVLKQIELSVRKPNYHSKSTTLQFQPGEVAQQDFTLESVIINLEVTATPQANVSLNGNQVGTTPKSFEASPEDVVTVSLDGFASESVTIEAVGPSKRILDFVLIDENQDRYNKAPETISVQNTISLRKAPAAVVRVEVPGVAIGREDPGTRYFELTRPYYLGTHEIRRSEYAKFDPKLSIASGEGDLPVTDVSWSDAARFCNWLSAQEGLAPVYEFASDGSLRVDSSSNGYRLPTEAEWEAAAQYDANTNSVIGLFPWGNSKVPRAGSGNYSGRESRHELNQTLQDHVDNHVNAAPVGSYGSNMNGFFDLAGNASEWVHDFYDSISYGLDQPLTSDPLGPSGGVDHIVKGANYRTASIDEMYVNARHVIGYRDETVGFRVARWIW